jgi:hypothetical protein
MYVWIYKAQDAAFFCIEQILGSANLCLYMEDGPRVDCPE